VTAGQVDILIGTHRLLQADVKFANSASWSSTRAALRREAQGTIQGDARHRRRPIDERNADSRTLYMALTARATERDRNGADQSHPIQTIVKTYDEKIVIDAIHHEIRRGGQVFYLHNRVQTIDLVAGRLREACPN